MCDFILIWAIISGGVMLVPHPQGKVLVLRTLPWAVILADLQPAAATM